MTIRLIPQARRAWRLTSVQVATLAVVWGSMPTDLQAAVLTAVGVPAERIPAVFGALFLLTRLIAQPKTTGQA